MGTTMTRTQARRVGKKIREKVQGPPEYKDWEQAEQDAIEHYLMNIKTLDGMGALVYNFGRDYKKLRQMVDFYSMVFALNTDKGAIAVDLNQVAVQEKSWWDRHFAGDRNTEATIALHLRGILTDGGKEYELHKWTAITDVNNIVEFAEFAAYQLREFAQLVYDYDFERIEKIVGAKEK